MLEKLKEFRETLSERLTSPFIGSFIITWCIMHWQIILLFFYQQDNLDIHDRIGSIKGYVNEIGYFALFFKPILVTFVILILISFLKAIGLTIKLSYDNWISPLIQQKLYNKNIVEKSKFEKIKIQYTKLKAEYDEDREKYVNTTREAKELLANFERFQKDSFEGNEIYDLSVVFNSEVTWENIHTYPNGNKGRETFSIDKRAFKLVNGGQIKIENAKATKDGKILYFEKIIDKEIIPNFLIKDYKGNYFGIENGNIQIVYKQTIPTFSILSAHYKCEDNYIDVTDNLNSFIDKGIYEININNSTMGGDPGFGKQKNLVIHYIVNEKRLSANIREGENANLRFK